MKRLFSFLLIFLTLTAFSFSDSIINDIDYFSKLFPVTEGSDSEKAALEYISTRLTELELPVAKTGFTETEGYHSFSSYIVTEIPGKSADNLITIVPVEGSYNAAAALFLAQYFNETTPELTLKFVFLGAEQSSEDNPGTRNFLEHFYPETNTAFIYFNFKDNPDSFKIVSGADGYSTPYALFHAVTASLTAADISYFHSNTESILFRLSAAGTESRIKKYLEDGYPSIELGCSSAAVEAPADLVDGDALAEFYTGLLELFSSGIPQEWDSHYILGINEQSYLLIFIVVLSALMIYPIFRRKHFGWYMHTLSRNFWSLPLLFGFVFIFLSFSSFMISFILNQLNFTEMWKYTPLRIFLAKLSITLLLYTLTFRFISRLPFSKRGSFYSISAIFFLVIALFLLTWIDLSLSFFALWSLCFIFLFTVFRKPTIKLLMLIISVIWVLLSLYEIFTLPSLRVIELLTFSPVKGNLLITLILMPFILAAIRLDLLAPPSRKLTRFLTPLLATASIALLLIIIFFSPFTPETPQPVTITEIISADTGETTFNIESPKELSSELQQRLADITADRSGKTDSVEFDIAANSFLNRKIINATLSFESEPEQVHFSLLSETPLILYESNYPAEWLPASSRLKVYIGSNPPLPLDISLTINKDAETDFMIEADFPAAVHDVVIDDTAYLVSRKKTVIKSGSDE